MPDTMAMAMAIAMEHCKSLGLMCHPASNIAMPDITRAVGPILCHVAGFAAYCQETFKIAIMFLRLVLKTSNIHCVCITGSNALKGS